jgi:hypothetical protein
MTRFTVKSGLVEIPDELLSGRLKIFERQLLAMMSKRPPSRKPNHLDASARHATGDLEQILNSNLAVRDRSGTPSTDRPYRSVPDPQQRFRDPTARDA